MARGSTETSRVYALIRTERLSGTGTTDEVEVCAHLRESRIYKRKASSNPMNQESKPFQKVVVAYDDSPTARDALNAGINLQASWRALANNHCY